MGRPSNREQKRREILKAFATVLADHGYAGATIAAVAREAGISPGLVHHHFDSKEDLLDSLLRELLVRFRARSVEFGRLNGETLPLAVYVDAALKLDSSSDTIAARCWVGLFSEAIRSPALFRKVRRMLDDEVTTIRRLSANELDDSQASSILAFVIGALVFGAFAPRKVGGFAAPALHQIVEAMTAANRRPRA
jgi:TetR/AcrR family transcriptional regulator, transcriptional repressor of bet genes